MKANMTYNNKDILTLIRSPLAKDQDKAFMYLYRNTYKTVQAMITRNNGKEEDAKDVFQDALIVVHKNLRKEDFELSCQIGTYVYSIARNLWLKSLRNKKVHLNIDDQIHDFIEIPEDTDAFILRAQRQDQLENMVQHLKGDCKRVLKLYYYERLKMFDIANKMGYSTEQVAKNKKSSCLKKLRHLLTKQSILQNSI